MGRDKTELPEGIPMLAPGRHFAPRAGGCFMEVTSVLAGERWSDHPKCTHPILAEAARLINDQVGDDSRQRLVRWIPEVIGTNRHHPMITGELIVALARHGLAARPDDRDLHWADYRARRRMARWNSGGRCWRGWLRATDYWFRTHERVRVPALLRPMIDCPDEVFLATLGDVIATYHRTARGLDASPAQAVGGRVAPVRAAADR